MELDLTRNKTSIVDDDRYKYLNQWKWHYSHGYAIRAEIIDSKQIKIYLHRFILGCPEGLEVDHINQDKLDNRVSNLRIVTRQQNVMNKGKNSNNTSGYKGVSFQKSANKWEASIGLDGHKIYLGLFADAIDAAKVYDQSALKFHGKFAKLNFPSG